MLPSKIYSAFAFVLMSISMTLLNSAAGKKVDVATMDNCEVCLTFMTKFIEELDPGLKSDPKKIEDAFRKKCKHTKKDDNRFCYYVGGLEESATGILGEMSKPVSWSMPADKVCVKLNRKDTQICELKYDKTLDLAKVNLKKLKVKDLKKILSDWDETCRGCTEKTDFIKLIEELMPKYAPDAHKARQQKTEL